MDLNSLVWPEHQRRCIYNIHAGTDYLTPHSNSAATSGLLADSRLTQDYQPAGLLAHDATPGQAIWVTTPRVKREIEVNERLQEPLPAAREQAQRKQETPILLEQQLDQEKKLEDQLEKKFKPAGKVAPALFAGKRTSPPPSSPVPAPPSAALAAKAEETSAPPPPSKKKKERARKPKTQLF